MRKRIGEILQELCRYRGIQILEGHAMVDHIHLCISVPPKYSIAMVIGYLKGKSAIRIHKEILGVKKGFTNKNFWTRGNCGEEQGRGQERHAAHGAQLLVARILRKHRRAERTTNPGIYP